MKRSTKIKIIRLALMTAAVTLICREPTTGESFPAAAAIISYMTSIHPGYIILSLPIAAGILPYTSRGIDPWGSLITMAISGLINIIIHTAGIQTKTWHLAAITSAINITVTSIYRLATSTSYQITFTQITLETAVITAVIYMTQNTYNCLTNNRHDPPITMAAMTAAILLMICGAGLLAMLWPAAVFVSIWAAATLPLGPAVHAITSAGITAALAGQPQWGFMITLIISAAAVSLYKKNNMLIKSIIFVFTSLILQTVESGVVLGIDNYILFLGGALYIAVSWKYEKRLRAVISKFAGEALPKKDESRQAAIKSIKIKSNQIGELAELYGTYLDSRSALAHQFSIMQQILDDAGRSLVKPAAVRSEKIDAEISVAQCAATGSINGDCCGWDEIGEGRIAAVISDGMGKGKKAAAESLLVVKTILTMLKCGAATDRTLKMINTIMMIKDDSDSFATVDLAIIDKCTAKLRIYKIGAAPTLMKRGENTEEIMLSAMPLGIVNGIRIQYVEKNLRKGDWLVMMSDGVSDGPDGMGVIGEIRDIIQEMQYQDCQTMCDIIINKSIDMYTGKERDDLTVMALRIM